MATPYTLSVVNATIVLSGPNVPFSDGHTTDYLEFYDERHHPPFPLTSQVIHAYVLTIISDLSAPPLWKAERVTGWMEALIENTPHTFRSCLAEGRMAVPQEA